MKKCPLPPRASSLSESMRDIGYSLETAVADIIDNSITAAASRVEIWFDFNSEKPVLGIIDNGKGMNREELIEAMRHGSAHPRITRSDDDLGRFGLGLKTASFSQCRELVVISRKDGISSGAIWELDVLLEHDEWILGILEESEILDFPYADKLNGDGTLVLWRELDRLCDGKPAKANQDVIFEKIEAMEKHLALVFHCFLSGEVRKKKLDIFVNDQQVDPFDPFCLDHSATQRLQEEVLRINGHEITIKPYILPHHGKLSPREHDYYGNRGEFLSNQGVYIYRNKRLMAWGGWFRLLPKGEATKLARVRIDFPNALDELWTIDIKKSRAYPPSQVKERLGQVIKRIAEQSTHVYTGRGRRLLENTPRPFWRKHAGRGGICYLLNREHPVLNTFESSMDEPKKKMFREILEIIEKSIPVESIYADYSTNPKSFEESQDIDSQEIRTKLCTLFDILSSDRQLNEENFRETVTHLKPFCEYPDEIEEIIKEKFRV